MERPGDTKEDWEIFDILCQPEPGTMSADEMSAHDMNTTLRSELAALQYKRDRLLTELQEMKGQLRNRDQRSLELQVETEQLKEQAARQNAVIASLRKRIQELEERERTLTTVQGRTEMTVSTLQRETRFQEDRARELERKVGRLELECHAEEQGKEAARHAMVDFVRRLSTALGSESPEPAGHDALVHKAAELVQETTRLRNRSSTLADTLSSVEVELRSCRDALERALADRENLQRQAASHMLEIDRLRQEKETLEIQKNVAERELSELREKLNNVSRSLGSATGNIAAQEITIINLKDDLKQREEKGQRLQNEMRHLLESLAILLSTPVRFVESQETAVKQRIQDLISENKDKTVQTDNLRDKVATLNSQLSRQTDLYEQANIRIRNLEDDKALLENKLHKGEVELSSCEVTKESLRRDKTIFVTFLERLARALNMEEISKEVGVDLHTESLLLRAEQLSRCESDKLVDKSAVVYQLQRRVRGLRDQIQRKDLHLDLLRRKLNLHEESCRLRSLLETERDEANLRVKKLTKQVDRLTLQLNDTRAQVRDLKLQLTEAGDFKMTAIERGRKIEDLQKRLLDSEMLRTRCTRKVTLLKDQVKTTSESAEQERTLCDHSIQVLRDDLSTTKANLADTLRRENLLLSLRNSVTSLLGLETTCPDYEIVSRLTKLVNAHREYTSVSRRYDDPVLPHLHRSPRFNPSPEHKVTPRYTSGHDDSGFLDPIIDDCDSDINTIYNKRPLRSS